MVGSDDEIWVNVRVNRKLWRQFQERCTAADVMPSDVVVGLLKRYLASPAQNGTIAPPSPSESRSDRDIREIVEDYLQQNLEPTVVQIVDRHLSSSPTKRPPDWSAAPKSVGPKPEKPRSPSPDPNLKTAKELAQILGVSPPYITTLNRLGELEKRGWEDAGQRRGKTILYRPISPT